MFRKIECVLLKCDYSSQQSGIYWGFVLTRESCPFFVRNEMNAKYTFSHEIVESRHTSKLNILVSLSIYAHATFLQRKKTFCCRKVSTSAHTSVHVNAWRGGCKLVNCIFGKEKLGITREPGITKVSRIVANLYMHGACVLCLNI